MTPRVALCIPNAADATAYYRALAPMSHLERFFQYRVSLLDQVPHASVQFYDLAFFQRPIHAGHLGAMNGFKKAGVPVIVDFDDDLLRVPEDNPTYFVFSDPSVRGNYLAALELADVITVTTAELRRSIVTMYPHQKVFVVRNALDERICHTQGEPHDRVLWRGSSTHQRDLMEVSGPLNEFNGVITYFGYNPWFIKAKKEVKPIVNSGMLDYFNALRALHPAIGIVPLHDSIFNRCKSNIAWLEMAWAGAACLVPQWEEWQHPGTYAYADFGGGLHWLSQNESARDDLRRTAWAFIEKNFMLKHTNQRRDAIFKAALGLTEWPNYDEALQPID